MTEPDWSPTDATCRAWTPAWVSDAKHDEGQLSVAVHGSVSVEYRELAEAIAFVRGARRNIEDDPKMAFRRLDELERLLEDLMARLEEHRS